MKRAVSLRSKLITTFMVLWLVSVVLATFAAYWFAGQAARVSFDRVLKDDALALSAQIQWSEQGAQFQLDQSTADWVIFDSSSPSQYAVFDRMQHLLSGDLSSEIQIDWVHAQTQDLSFSDVQTSKGMIRLVILRIKHASHDWAWVVVAESSAKRSQISHELAAAIFLPAVGLAFLVIPLLLAGIRVVFAPAQSLSEAVAQKSIDDLSALELDDVPTELRTVSERINELLQRLQEAVEHERRFIADAAHQLRTPIAGIKVLAQDLARGLQAHPSQAPDAEVVHELQAAATRATHLVQQLLSLARNELSQIASDQIFALSEVIEQILVTWERRFQEAGKEFKVTLDSQGLSTLRLKGQSIVLAEAFNNLLDNALKYGGDRVTLALRLDDDQVTISISDNGQAVSESDIAQLVTPFWRGSNVAVGGVGLGLAIVAGAVRQLGGQLQFNVRPDYEGFRVQLILPTV